MSNNLCQIITICIITMVCISYQMSTYNTKTSPSLKCDMCPPGYYKHEDCTSNTKTVCSPCGEGEYTAYNNSLTKCLRCSDCYGENEITTKQCTNTSNTVCECMDGYTKDETIDACIKS
ncbi:SWPV1-076 [Shearwaterpox virus]|uniref:SWPV1-076 n=1 Tax=Shearwaterpox virus TaxID=1974596 RepID=A0A1V0S7S8_CNPV|nr:SWPV1-076 [Shearwaterpox virus]